MASPDVTRAAGTPRAQGRQSTVRRLASETKAAIKTTEMYAYVAAVIGVLIAANAIEAQDGGPDVFRADKAWLYITILTVGYMVSRGLAKSGSSDPYWDDSGQDRSRDAR